MLNKMPVTRCPNGHFYDPDLNPSCPWCAVPEDNEGTKKVFNQTIQMNGNGEGATVRVSNQTQPQQKPFSVPSSSIDEGHTIAVVKRKTGIDPVVGWLVCIEGPDRGRDYRIRTEKNSVGRSDSMDIAILGDETISRNDHAFIVYDPKKNIFRVQSGSSRGLVYLNGEEVISSETIKAYDTIEMGESAFKFIPFCGGEFKWKEPKVSKE